MSGVSGDVYRNVSVSRQAVDAAILGAIHPAVAAAVETALTSVVRMVVGMVGIAAYAAAEHPE